MNIGQMHVCDDTDFGIARRGRLESQQHEVYVLFHHHDQMLVLNTGDVWRGLELPGGPLQKGETIAESVQRTAFEQLDISIYQIYSPLAEFRQSITISNEGYQRWNELDIRFLLMDILEPEAERYSYTGNKIRWVTLSEIMQLQSFFNLDHLSAVMQFKNFLKPKGHVTYVGGLVNRNKKSSECLLPC